MLVCDARRAGMRSAIPLFCRWPPCGCSLTSIAEQHHSVRTTRMDGVQVRRCAVHPAAIELGTPLEANGLVACTAW